MRQTKCDCADKHTHKQTNKRYERIRKHYLSDLRFKEEVKSNNNSNKLRDGMKKK